MFGVLWLIYFPLRIVLIVLDQNSEFLFDPVRVASGKMITDTIIVTTVALYSFYVGTTLIKRSGLFHVNDAITRSTFFLLALLGTGVAIGIKAIHIQSGLGSNIAAVSQFGIAGLAFYDWRGHRATHSITVALLLLNSYIGFTSGFKEDTLLPVAAYLLGAAAAGVRVRLRLVVVSLVAISLVFLLIQGRRTLSSYGLPSSSPVNTVLIELHHYDLAHGTPHDYHGWSQLTNLANGVLFRLRGADYFIVVRSRVPSRVAYAHGRAIIFPALSIVPGSSRIFRSQDYNQLSLGRFVTRRFISGEQSEDPSSQSLTIPGDLFLNFGDIGVVVGMALIGAFLKVLSAALSLSGPTSAGLLAMVGLQLAAVDRNIAYALVTGAIRFGIVYLACTAILRQPLISARFHPES